MTLTSEEYVEREGANCPACESTDIAGDKTEMEPGHYYQKMACNECHAEWWDHYKLNHYERLKDKGGESI